jgi:hypothetical protein
MQVGSLKPQLLQLCNRCIVIVSDRLVVLSAIVKPAEAAISIVTTAFPITVTQDICKS